MADSALRLTASRFASTRRIAARSGRASAPSVSGSHASLLAEHASSRPNIHHVSFTDAKAHARICAAAASRSTVTPSFEILRTETMYGSLTASSTTSASPSGSRNA